MNFRKISEGGGGGISDLKKIVAKFLALDNDNLFFCGGVIFDLKKKDAKISKIFPKKGQGGGAKAVKKFSKTHPFLKRQASLTCIGFHFVLHLFYRTKQSLGIVRIPSLQCSKLHAQRKANFHGFITNPGILAMTIIQ